MKSVVRYDNVDHHKDHCDDRREHNNVVEVIAKIHINEDNFGHGNNTGDAC